MPRPTHPYLPMAHGFMYLAAILDVASRKVLAFRLSNTLTTDFCVDALQEALAKFGRPEIFNTDQGSQPGFNWSSQHCLCERSVALRQDTRLAYASRVSCGVCC